jgi:hypothetical protein
MPEEWHVECGRAHLGGSKKGAGGPLLRRGERRRKTRNRPRVDSLAVPCGTKDTIDSSAARIVCTVGGKGVDMGAR